MQNREQFRGIGVVILSEARWCRGKNPSSVFVEWGLSRHWQPRACPRATYFVNVKVSIACRSEPSTLASSWRVNSFVEPGSNPAALMVASWTLSS